MIISKIKTSHLGENSPLGNHLIDFENFNHDRPKSSLRLKFSKSSQSNTANARILRDKILDSSEKLKSSLRESGANEAIYKNTESKDSKHLDSSLDCHDLPCKSRNDKIAESNLERSDNAINATLSQTSKSVVGGEGESCERGRGERLRVCAEHQPTLAHSSPFSLSQSGINESNEVAEQFKKSESKAERNQKDFNKNENLGLSLRESEANEAIYNAESKSVKSEFMDCHDSAFAESRNDRKIESKNLESNTDSNRLPRSLATSCNDEQILEFFNDKQVLDSRNDKNAESPNKIFKTPR